MVFVTDSDDYCLTRSFPSSVLRHYLKTSYTENTPSVIATLNYYNLLIELIASSFSVS